MYLLLFLVIVMAIYVDSFKDNFSKEHIDKIVPVLTLSGVVVFILCIILSALSS